MSFATITDPEYYGKSNFKSAKDYYAAEEANAEYEELKADNSRLIDDVNEQYEQITDLETAYEFLKSEHARVCEENMRLAAKCDKLEEYSAEQFNRAVSLQHDLDMIDKLEDEEALFDSDCWEAFN